MSLSTAPILSASSARVNVGPRYLISLVCAASGGVHAALTPQHWGDRPALGVAFAGSAAALLLAAVLLRRPCDDCRPLAWAALVLAMTALAYLFSRTTGIAPLISAPEQFDSLGLLTTAAEAGALLSCLLLLIRKDIS
jgi:hypothetical protein